MSPCFSGVILGINEMSAATGNQGKMHCSYYNLIILHSFTLERLLLVCRKYTFLCDFLFDLNYFIRAVCSLHIHILFFLSQKLDASCLVCHQMQHLTSLQGSALSVTSMTTFQPPGLLHLNYQLHHAIKVSLTDNELLFRWHTRYWECKCLFLLFKIIFTNF